MSPVWLISTTCSSAESSAARGNFTPNDLSPRGKSMATNNNLQASTQVYVGKPGHEMSWQLKQGKKKSSTTLRFNLMKLEICIWLEFSCIQHNLNWRCAFGAAVKCQQTSDSLASYFLCIAPKQLSLYWRIYDRSVTPYFAAKCCVKRE